ncbi:MAG: hypothetical protein AAFN59_06010 [Pseudomonadota bacterium]
MVKLLSLLALLGGLGQITDTSAIQCTFERPQKAAVEVRLEPLPSLKDQPGLFYARMIFDGHPALTATVRPISTTPGRDVMIRAVARKTTYYTIAVDAHGTAAFNMMHSGQPEAQKTYTGSCRSHEAHLTRWIP